ncbi:MAG: T9SS type A sorting domain-containing protein, partial [Gelidibacter sp.]|nr:T9SS type A sorting domain-containing protein [Gelidibacter sp.]
GGAGGGSDRNGRHGGGGGGGGYATNTFSVTPGQIINYTIGAGGIGNDDNGDDGGTTNILSLTANGGKGGKKGNPTGGNGGAGGNASGGTTNTTGIAGQNGTATVSGNGGNGANGGIGGIGGNSNDGGNGATPGGGGGGGEAFWFIFHFPQNGGNGGNGQISITYTTNNTYCSPSFNSGVRPITNVTFENINNTTSNVIGGENLQSFCGIATVQQGSITPISIKSNTNGNNQYNVTVFIDWNQTGIFGDNINERYDIGTITNSNGIDNITLNGSITAPANATVGLTRMRVIKKYNGYVTDACQNGNIFGQAEDYSVNVTVSPPCIAPTAQPTNLNLTATNNSINGTFNPANPTADNYLVVMNTTGTPPNPNNTTTYNTTTPPNNIVGAGNFVIDVDDNTNFTASGLNNSTTYYFFIFSYNKKCTGGPLYNLIAPLTGNALTTNTNYCIPNSNNSNYYINNVRFLGTLQDVSNLNTGRGTTNGGYSNFTSLPLKCIQAQGEGVNVFVEASDRARLKAWIDWNRNGIFDAPELVYSSGGTNILSTTFGFVIPANQIPGDYRIRIRNRQSNDPEPCNNRNNGEAEDYLFTVVASCNATINSVTNGENCGPGQVLLSATGSGSTTSYNWYTTATGGTPDPTQHGNTFLSPNIIATTTYYVTAVSNSCESLVRQPVTATISPITDLIFTPNTPEICGEGDIIEVSATGNQELVYLINEDFESGNLNTFFNVENSPSNDATNWINRQSTLQFPVTGPYADIWLPAISSGINNNRFALAIYDLSGTHYNSLTSSANPSTIDFTDLTLTFDLYYSRYEPDNQNLNDDYISLEVATNAAGTNWTEINRYTTDIGIGTRFAKQTFDLSNYIDDPAETNIRVRLRYYGSYVDGAAVDNIKIFGNRPLINTAFNWTSSIPVNVYTNAAATLPYVANTPIAGSIYVKPDYFLGQLEADSFVFTAQATLANNCVTSEDITIFNKSKIWIGDRNSSQDWDNPLNWAPNGVPTSDHCVIVPSIVKAPHNRAGIPPTGYEAFAKNLTIKPLGDLELLSTNNLIVTDFINIDTGGEFNLENQATLLQINSVANSGIAKIKRNTQPMSSLDYTYWGSPVTLASNFTLNDLSPNTPASLFYFWNPTTNLGAGNYGAGDWIGLNPNNTNMIPGKGYIVRAPTGHIANDQYIALFEGTPENGNIIVPIVIGNDGNVGTSVGGSIIAAEDDQWNLIANPYPSAIDAIEFLDETNNQTVIDGTVYLWTHNTTPLSWEPDPFYGDFGYNYTSNDYATMNYMGGTYTAAQANTGGLTPTQYIASGQGFFVMGLTNGHVVFNNDMRVKNNNDTFFRSNNTSTENESVNNGPEKHRLWLNLSDNGGGFSQILIGYADGATLGWDRGYDGLAFGGNKVTLYSIIPDKILTIQGRPLPFDVNDQIPLGIITTAQNSFTIGIDHLDDSFIDQSIYLEDTYIGIIHDLKTSPYSFASAQGTFNDRFVLHYTNQALGVGELENNELTIMAPNGDYIKVKSTQSPIHSVIIYDILGRALIDKKNINSSEFIFNEKNLSGGTYMVKAILVNGKHKIQKVILKQ